MEMDIIYIDRDFNSITVFGVIGLIHKSRESGYEIAVGQHYSLETINQMQQKEENTV